MIGKIQVRPLEAIITRDTGGVICNMSPYIKVKLNAYALCT